MGVGEFLLMRKLNLDNLEINHLSDSECWLLFGDTIDNLKKEAARIQDKVLIETLCANMRDKGEKHGGNKRGIPLAETV